MKHGHNYSLAYVLVTFLQHVVVAFAARVHDGQRVSHSGSGDARFLDTAIILHLFIAEPLSAVLSRLLPALQQSATVLNLLSSAGVSAQLPGSSSGRRP